MPTDVLAVLTAPGLGGPAAKAVYRFADVDAAFMRTIANKSSRDTARQVRLHALGHRRNALALAAD